MVTGTFARAANDPFISLLGGKNLLRNIRQEHSFEQIPPKDASFLRLVEIVWSTGGDSSFSTDEGGENHCLEVFPLLAPRDRRTL
mmetsp:Transcript_5860/g.24626  ORF Transcript_5860/g.24626 Transcript_5860/m.24626 type:complete len:85 (+) Transcript_5860:1163-1417(+)